MTISNDLFLAILSMDSYNRGYDAGITGLGGEGARIGAATITKDAEQLLSAGEAEAAGFYAIAYKITDAGVDGLSDGDVVISYRGTDVLWHELPFVDLPIWSGDYDEPQLELAAKFYQSVATPANGAPPSGAIELTGHSLGGGSPTPPQALN
ncbi:hypothetical protein [uncultured Hoeflea sp.]|uniref:hypothetical protein n=1 Tax=uncultured Hoeflea sp. TaxID=538666 RepID=UPI002607445E|nr:hypothetical protein [uncultured Hoeflea sp.]